MTDYALERDIKLTPDGDIEVSPHGDVVLTGDGLQTLAQHVWLMGVCEPGEVMMHPEFGCGIPSTLGDPEYALEVAVATLDWLLATDERLGPGAYDIRTRTDENGAHVDVELSPEWAERTETVNLEG